MNSKTIKLIEVVLFVISAVLGVCVFLFNGDDNKMISPILNWAYILLAISVVLVLVLPLFFRSGKGGKKTVVELGVLVVLLVISFLMASVDPVKLTSLGAAEPTHSVLKWTDTVLILSCILLVLAFLVAVFGGMFKKGLKK